MEDFLKQAGISYVKPEDGAEFDSIQISHTGLHKSSQPAIITLPETASQVASIVKQCITQNQEFVVRGAGHDCHGRFSVAGAVSIDLRKLNSVTISQDRTTATIGGGTHKLHLLSILEEHGLQAAAGICGDIGYTGWCLIGGLGPLTTIYGIGSDQIVGATVVNAREELVKADARLLKGLRGGGGCLAIVVELDVKAYPIQDIYFSHVVYETDDVRDAVFNLFTNFQNLLDSQTQPINLSLEAHFVDKGPPRPYLGIDFLWMGVMTEECNAWLKMVQNLAPLKSGAPESAFALHKTTVKDFVALHTQNVAPVVSGQTHAPSVTHYSPQMAAIFADMASTLPKGCAGGFGMHTIRKESPSCSPGHPDSVSPYRVPLVVVEILGFAVDEKAVPAAVEWARLSQDRISKSDAAVPEAYLALTAPETLHLPALYGSKLQELERLKSEYDPDNVFRHSLPKLDL